MRPASPSRQRGFSLVELMVALGIVALLASVSVTAYVNYLELAQVGEEVARIAAVQAEVRTRLAMGEGQLVRCDQNLVGGAALESPWIDLKILPIRIDPRDVSAGYAASIRVLARVDRQGTTGPLIALGLHDALLAQGAEIREGVLRSTIAIYQIIVSRTDRPVCLDVAAGPA